MPCRSTYRNSASGATGSPRSPPTSATSVSTPRPGPGSTRRSTTTPVTAAWRARRLIAGLLKGLLDLGVDPHTNARAVELIADPLARSPAFGSPTDDNDIRGPRARAASCWPPADSSGTPAGRGVPARPDARRGVTAEQHRRRACAWRWRTAPTWPTWAKRGGCRSCRSPATPSTGSRAAAACGLNAPAREASSSTGPASGSSTRPANTTRWPGPFHYLDPARRLRQRPGVDRLRRPAPQTLRLPRRRTRRRKCPTGFRHRRDLDRARRQDGHRRRMGWPARSRLEPQRRRRARSRFRPRRQRLRRVLGRSQGHHAGRADTGPDRHRSVLCGAGVHRRDGHQGRTAHRPRRSGPARQRRPRSRGCTLRATPWPA